VRRREFITLIGGAVAASPLAVRAQQEARPLIGFLGAASPVQFADGMLAFHQGLSETGFTEGQNVAIEYRWAENQLNRLPQLAADLVHRGVAVIATGGASPAALAAKAATTTIPVVFQVGVDPVALGLVESLNRPGGNVTGVTSLNVELAQKRLEVLHQLVSTATTMALLVNPATGSSETQSQSVLAASRELGLQLHVLQASSEQEIDAVFASLHGLGISGLVISADPLFAVRNQQLAELSVRFGTPSISPYRAFAKAGGILSYGGSLTDQYRQLGVYTGRILKGARPADLPVEQITTVELIVNVKTARALGLNVPLTLLGRDDEVIE
jgi:putative tryptophan/tyrosine transport system substrate-binding protein